MAYLEWRERRAEERVCEREVGPRGVAQLGFGAVALSEILNYMTAWKGRLGGGFKVVVTATSDIL